MIQEWGAFLILLLLTAAAWQHGIEYAITPLAYLTLLILSFFFRAAQERHRIQFMNQLKSHRKELRHGGSVLVDGLILHYHSWVTTYHYVIGGLFFSILIPSRYRRADRSSSAEGYLSALCSFLTGWWSLPHGPLITIATALQNVHGGERTSVAELIDGALLEPQPARKKSAQDADKKEEKKVATGPGSRSQHHLEEQSYPAGWRPLTAGERKKARKILAKVFDVPPGEHDEPDETPKPHPSKLPEQLAKRKELEKVKKAEADRKPGKELTQERKGKR